MGWSFLYVQKLLLALDVLVDGLCAFLACAHCQNNGCSTGNSVAAGENAFTGGNTELVCVDAALLGEVQALSGLTDQGVGAGADCDNNGVALENPLAAGDGNGERRPFASGSPSS